MHRSGPIPPALNFGFNWLKPISEMRVTYSFLSGLVFASLLAANAASAGDDKDSRNTVESAAKATINEIGKGLEAVGKAVGPAVNKVEKAVRGTKDDGDKRTGDRK